MVYTSKKKSLFHINTFWAIFASTLLEVRRWQHKQRIKQSARQT